MMTKRKIPSWLFPFVGATIVLSTFVVKDTWSESLRSFIDALESTQTAFLIRADDNNLLRTLHDIQLDIYDLPTAGRKSLTTGEKVGRLNGEAEVVTLECRRVEDFLETMDRLNEMLPADGDRRKNLTMLKESLSTLRNEAHDMDLASIAPGVISTEGKKLVTGSKSNDKGLSMELVLWALNDDVDSFSEGILKEARKLKDTKEHDYRIAKFFSFGLYGLGWVVGLIGKLVGEKGLEVE
jgi:hypothetical protein